MDHNQLHASHSKSPSQGMSRRNMLRWATVAAATLATRCAAIDSAVASSIEDTGCTLGFSTYGMKNIPTQKALRVLNEIGFDAVELAVREGWDADSANLNAGGRQALQRMLRDIPLRLSSLMEHVYPTDDRRQKVALDRLKMAAELAHDLVPDRPPIVQTVLGSGEFDLVKEQIRDRLAAWVNVADTTETTIAIKPHRGGVVSQPMQAIWLFEQLGQPQRLRMVYDYSHYAFRKMTVPETVRAALPFTVHVAVKDAIEQDDRVVFKLPGETGTFDYAELIRRFFDGGYRGDFNCEVSGMVSNKNGYDPVAAAKICYRGLSAAFDASGVPRTRPA